MDMAVLKELALHATGGSFADCVHNNVNSVDSIIGCVQKKSKGMCYTVYRLIHLWAPMNGAVKTRKFSTERHTHMLLYHTSTLLNLLAHHHPPVLSVGHDLLEGQILVL